MKTSSIEDVSAFYDSAASGYAQLMDGEIDLPLYADVLGRLAERLADLEGPVVDTSCGPGHMLARYHERHEPTRALVGVDLSPRMVALAGERLGDAAEVRAGDMRALPQTESGSSAAVISFFAAHHLGPTELAAAFVEWARVLRGGGQLVVAAWEGSGAIDYGEVSDVVALRYTKEQVEGWASAAGLTIDRCAVEAVDGMEMDAVYLEASKQR